MEKERCIPRFTRYVDRFVFTLQNHRSCHTTFRRGNSRRVCNGNFIDDDPTLIFKNDNDLLSDNRTSIFIILLCILIPIKYFWKVSFSKWKLELRLNKERFRRFISRDCNDTLSLFFPHQLNSILRVCRI